MTDSNAGVCSQLARCPRKRPTRPGCLRLVWLSPSASSHHLPRRRGLQPWPSPCTPLLARDTRGGGRIRFSHSSVWETAPERAAASAGECPWGLGGRPPGSAPSFSFIPYEGRSRSRGTLLRFLSLFLCQRQQGWWFHSTLNLKHRNPSCEFRSFSTSVVRRACGRRQLSPRAVTFCLLRSLRRVGEPLPAACPLCPGPPVAWNLPPQRPLE